MPNLVKSCSSLVKLSLGHKSLTINPFTDGICKNGATLTSLNLSGCLYISYDAIRMILFACKELIEANFSAIFPLTEASISFLCLHLTPTIRKLSLEEQYVTDQDINNLAERAHLLELNLDKCYRISHYALISIVQHLPNLQKLHFPSRINYERLKVLRSLNHLTHFWMPSRCEHERNERCSFAECALKHKKKIKAIHPHVRLNDGELLIPSK